MRRPGDRLLVLAEGFIDRRTIARLVAPAVADLQHEYSEAARQAGPWPRRLALAHGYVSLLRLAAPVALGCARRFSTGFLVEDDGVIGRLLAFMLAAVGVLSAMLVLPPFLELRQRWPIAKLPVQVLLLMPQALGLALPLGLLTGALFALRRKTPLRNRVTIVRLASVALTMCLLTLATTAWLIPAGNQRFRQVVADALTERYGRPVPVHLEPGPNEMTFAEIARHIELRRSVPGSESEVHALQFSYQVRLALALSPIALLLLAVGVSSLARGRWSAIIATVVANPLSVMVIWGRVLFESTPLVQAWLPVVMMAAAGSLMIAAGWRRARVGSA